MLALEVHTVDAPSAKANLGPLSRQEGPELGVGSAGFRPTGLIS